MTTPKEFLTSFRYESGGQYTCLRLHKGRICMWKFHQDRLGEASEELQAKVFAHAREKFGEMVHLMDVMLTIVNVNGDFRVHVYKMPGLLYVENTLVPTVKSIATIVLGSPRCNPEVKHVEWIHDRKPLEELATRKAKELGISSFGEVLLSRLDTKTGNTELLEGLITNFFVVQDRRLYTAPNDVLLGSTRALVFEACEKLGIQVVLHAPIMEQCDLWEAAFVTSVVRIVVPIESIHHQNKSSEAWHHDNIHQAPELLDQIRQTIYELIAIK
ncbi:hypothetical protein THRCLA_01734 [Thraustotheca clavata]|uniref:Thioredoxin-like protein n=1 Tax=Thraustotheca clavata TaxID=74557 RepID=A0A1W0A7N2_9STRA|nr:hypothetical protein THRCLA_01734 [Thraustotheca clavata]